MSEENYAIDCLMNPDLYPEVICLNCGHKYHTFKILGTDNVFRQLPHHCRKCENWGEINENL